MIISEKQIMQLIQLGQLYLRQLNDLDRMDSTLLSKCGHHNKIHVAKLLQDIAEQQSEELKTITDKPTYINQNENIIKVKCAKCKTEFLVHHLQNINTDYLTDCELHRKEG